MNEKQRRVLVTVAIVIAATMFYVPVNVPVGSIKANRTSLEYHWLFSGLEGTV
jgi:hypothetical protein